MRALSTPSGCVCPKESDGVKGEDFLDPGGQNCGPAGTVADDEAFYTASISSASSGTWSSTCEAAGNISRVHHAGTEWDVEPAGVRRGPTSCLTCSHPRRLPSGTEIDNEIGACNVAHGENHARGGVGGGVVDCDETTFIMPQVSSDGFVEEGEDHGIDAADWLDVTHAMLDVVHEPG